jgi:hypothetical protein
MSTVTFDTQDPAAEARALVTTLNLWLSEQPPPEQPPRAARGRFTYADDGSLRTVTVTLDEV